MLREQRVRPRRNTCRLTDKHNQVFEGDLSKYHTVTGVISSSGTVTGKIEGIGKVYRLNSCGSWRRIH